MKKTAILFTILISIAALSACENADANTSGKSGENKMTIEMELDKDYDDTEPFVNEELFCVTEDLHDLSADGTVEIDGESIILEVKNNRTNEVLWSNTWEGNVKSEAFSLSLANLTKDDEYVVCMTGRGINYAGIKIAFDSSFVRGRAKPQR